MKNDKNNIIKISFYVDTLFFILGFKDKDKSFT